MLEKGITLDALKLHHNKVVLSNMVFYLLKSTKTDRKSSGYYHKRKLVERGLIKTRRVINFVKKSTYKETRTYRMLPGGSRFFYKAGAMWEESVSEFTTSNFAEKKTTVKVISKALPYLEFDFIHFCKTAELR